MLSIFVFLLSLIAVSVARPAVTHTTTLFAITTTSRANGPTKAATGGGALKKKTTTSIATTRSDATRKRTSTATSSTENVASRRKTTTSSKRPTTTSSTRTSTSSTTRTTALTTSTTLTSSTSTSTSTSTSASTTTTSGYMSSTTFSFPGATLPSGLGASNWVVNTTPLAHQFVPQNAYVGGGYLNLLVPGNQSTNSVIQAGEVSTDFTVESASVETYAILTEVPGVVNGMFYYEGHTQETDVEWLSSAQSNSNVQTNYKRAMFYTNQPTVAGGTGTQVSGPPPLNPTTTVHNYQLVWVNNQSTSFYIDGKHQYTITDNVANATDGRWFWNNWSSGDPYWSVGPPKNDAVFRIQKIVMHYNPGT